MTSPGLRSLGLTLGFPQEQKQKQKGSPRVVMIGIGSGIGTGVGRPGRGDGPRRRAGLCWCWRRGWRPSGWVGVMTGREEVVEMVCLVLVEKIRSYEGQQLQERYIPVENGELGSVSVVGNPSFIGSGAASEAKGESERVCASLTATACRIRSSIVATLRPPLGTENGEGGEFIPSCSDEGTIPRGLPPARALIFSSAWKKSLGLSRLSTKFLCALRDL